jgi:hypothetical protein
MNARTIGSVGIPTCSYPGHNGMGPHVAIYRVRMNDTGRTYAVCEVARKIAEDRGATVVAGDCSRSTKHRAGALPCAECGWYG